MELLNSSASSRQQLLAVGDEVGTLHIFEVPRNLSKPVHKEESLMLKFLERELQVHFYNIIIVNLLCLYDGILHMLNL